MITPDNQSPSSNCRQCGKPIDSSGEIADATKCPACGAELGASDDLQIDALSVSSGGEDDIYALRTEPEPRPQAVPLPQAEPLPGRDFRDPRAVAQRAAELEEQAFENSAWLEVRRAPPRELFFSDTFKFPFRPDTRVPVIILLVGAIATFATFGLAVSSASAVKARPGAADGSSGSLGLMALGVVFALAWIYVAAICGLAVFRHTTESSDSTDNRFRLFSSHWASDPWFVLGGLVIGMLPGLITAPLWDWLEWPKSLPVTVTANLLFPLLLLSMLENNSPTQPVCPPVWQSVSSAWRAWGLFYLLTLPAAVIVNLLAFLAMKYLGSPGALVAGPLLAAAWMIYFRLLGRLAWFCSGRADA
jgi:hypothetical protein